MGMVSPGMYGTADAVALDKSKGILHVVDFKFGEGIVVDVKDNPQLEYYALGALRTLKFPCRKVRMTIIQPRAYHPAGHIRHWDVDAIHFLDVEADILKEIKKVWAPKPTYKAGAHCLFCRAANKCEEKLNSKVEAARIEFARKPRDPVNAKHTQHLSLIHI